MAGKPGIGGKAKYKSIHWDNVCARTRYDRKNGVDIRDQPIEDDGSEYTPDQVEFIMAVDRERRKLRKVQLSVKDVIYLVKRLGYVRMPPHSD